MDTSRISDNISKLTIILLIVGVLSALGVYFTQKSLNDTYADGIINDVWVRAEQRKNNLEIKDSASEDEIKELVEKSRIGRQGYIFTVLDDSTTSLVKVETAKKSITSGVCRSLKNKIGQAQWLGVFEKVVILDRMGKERVDITINPCPHQSIPMLRFYVRFAPDKKPEEPVVEEEEVVSKTPTTLIPSSEELSPPSSGSNYVSSPQVKYTRPDVPAPKTITCPSGTSIVGHGGIATSGCRCNNSDEIWNGHSCELKACPPGSSRTGKGDWTDMSGCRCNEDTPHWFAGHCMAKCKGDKVFKDGECVCPVGMVSKKDSSDRCVECNETSDCFWNYSCIDHKCVENGLGNQADCRWGICQMCDENTGIHSNILDSENCEVAGLHGICNGNGTCYPTEGQPCASGRACPKGEFCNYGGNLNSSQKQIGKFGQTPNVCQVVTPEEFTYKNVTYYFNSQKDLKAWCRAANNKANCLWGYLSKPGAESWCASLGKRLLTRSEMASVWNVLKDHLPRTYTGYSYWVQEGAWIVGKTGKRSFSKAYLDGYGGKGGVVCR